MKKEIKKEEIKNEEMKKWRDEEMNNGRNKEKWRKKDKEYIFLIRFISYSLIRAFTSVINFLMNRKGLSK